jgi:hypothetical protein
MGHLLALSWARLNSDLVVQSRNRCLPPRYFSVVCAETCPAGTEFALARSHRCGTDGHTTVEGHGAQALDSDLGRVLLNNMPDHLFGHFGAPKSSPSYRRNEITVRARHWRLPTTSKLPQRLANFQVGPKFLRAIDAPYASCKIRTQQSRICCDIAKKLKDRSRRDARRTNKSVARTYPSATADQSI